MPSRNTLDKIEKKHKRWTEEDMERAFIEVKSGRYTVRKAAIQFGVPKSSLGDRVSGRVAPGRRSGPPRLLSPADEERLVECASAAGLDLPPFIVYAKSCPQGASYKTQGPPEALYGSSDSGFVNTELFKKWFLRHFLLYAPSDRPLVLIFDGNKWPVHLEVLEVAWREKVVLLCLPPHCAHVLQPLDAGFSPLLKQHFLTLTGDGCGVSKNEFSRVLKASYEAVKDDQGVRVVVDGFRKCGIYPLSAFTSHESDRMSAHSLSPVAGSVLSTSELDCQSVRDLDATQPSA
ncbi:zinc finger protein 346 isoform X6 [Synchiropus splendidus]|uniref:zinc finger protein 346 isoform X6 n=1 Tax=Synchiropus splendidus TaxID=270530 RepID=UPI00237D8FAB|nr:zinc finger protein 346 isoform X6 [Synchiropus splendidus]